MTGSWMADRVVDDGPPGIDRSDVEVGGMVGAVGDDVANLKSLVLRQDAVGVARAHAPDESVDTLIRVPATAAVAHLHEPRPDAVGGGME